jgi:multiple sugar transport system substrate-binding protein
MGAGGVTLAACGAAPQEGQTGPATSRAPAALQIVVAQGQPNVIAFKKMVAEFTASRPGTTVTIDETPLAPGQDQEGKLKALLAAGHAPDIAHTQMATALLFAKLSSVHALDKLIAGSKLTIKSLVHSSLEPGSRLDGKTVTIPTDVQSFVIWMNKDLLAAKGIPLPRHDWTWQDFAETARRLNGGSGAGRVWGFQADMFWSRFEPWIYQSGGAPFDAVNFPARSLIDQPPAIAAIQFLQDLTVKQQIMMAPQEKAEWTANNNRYNFPWRKGAVAMEFGHTNGINTFPQEIDFRYDPWPLPRQAKAATTMVVNAMVIFTTTRHLDESWEFVRFGASDAAMRYIVSDANRMPASKELAEKLFIPFARQQGGVPNPQPFVDAFDYGYPQTNTPALFTIQNECLRPVWPKLMDRGEPVKDHLVEGAKLINEWLKV